MFPIKLVLDVVTKAKLSVFLFHKVPKITDELFPNDITLERFIRLIDFISDNFVVLPLAEAVDKLQRGKLPRRAAAISFDDGYPEWRLGAVELLLQRSIPATFFITAGQFDGRPMWHERLANIVRHYSGDVLDTQAVRLPPLKVSDYYDKVVAVQALEYHFKYLPPVIRDRFLEDLEAATSAHLGQVSAFSSGDLVDIANKGFEIGAHTLDHPILGLCTADQALAEIGKTREILEGIVKRPVKGFAYPNGRPWIDFSWRHIDMVKAAGYDYAVTTQWGSARSDTSPYQIPRFTPWGPSRRMMTLQLLRNIFTVPEIIPEVRKT